MARPRKGVARRNRGICDCNPHQVENGNSKDAARISTRRHLQKLVQLSEEAGLYTVDDMNGRPTNWEQEKTNDTKEKHAEGY